MFADKRLSAQAYFLHERLLYELIPPDERADFDSDVERRARIFPPGAARAGAYEALVASILELHQVKELALAYVSEDLPPGQLVTATQNFYVKQTDDLNARIHAQLDVNRDIRLEGRISLSRTVGDTGRSEIFGQTRYTVVAYLESDETEDGVRTLTLRPIFIGFRVEPEDASVRRVPGNPTEVFPSMVDQFAEADFSRKPPVAATRAVTAMPEEAIKHAFAEIVGESYVGKDWGGENSDLFTDKITISGRPTTTAFAFKGPGKKGPLYISKMGSRADQAIRLASEPADLLVVQHHGKIEPAVRHLMTALARDRGKLFMILDGQTTATILGAYNKLPG